MEPMNKDEVISRIRETLDDYCGEISYKDSLGYAGILAHPSYASFEDGLVQKFSGFYDFSSADSGLLEIVTKPSKMNLYQTICDYYKKNMEVTHIVTYLEKDDVKYEIKIFENSDPENFFEPKRKKLSLIEKVESVIKKMNDRKWAKHREKHEAPPSVDPDWLARSIEFGYWADPIPGEAGYISGSGSPFD